MVRVSLGLKASDNVVFWAYEMKKEEEVSICSLNLIIETKSLYLFSWLSKENSLSL
ncbi:hypothetical protein AB4K20DRAFT_1884868 [Rhizopus microsporus]